MKKERLISTIWLSVEAVIMLALGILTIVFSNNHDFRTVIGYIIGGLILLDGILRIVLFIIGQTLSTRRIDLYRGISQITVGIVLLLVPDVVVYYFTLFVAIGLTVIGITVLVDAIISNVRHIFKFGKQLLFYVMAVIILGLGIVSICFYPFKNPQTADASTISVMLIILGIIICIGALVLVGYEFGKNRKIAKDVVNANKEAAESRK